MMKRPARLRANSALHNPSSNTSMLSRVPLLHVNDLSLHSWDVSEHIPGLRIPLAFLSSLRTNLQISSSNEDLLPPSPLIPVTNTPDPLKPIPRISAETKIYSTLPSSNFNGLENECEKESDSQNFYPPPLTTFSATKEEDILSALSLVSESVAQQRQIAAKCIIFHPAVLAASIMTFLTIGKLLYTGSPSDLVLMLALWSACGLFAVLTIRYMVKGYTALAERVGNWSWLSESSVNGVSQRRDEILVTKFGDDIVAVLVLRIAKTVTNTGIPGMRPRSSRRKSSARWTGIIRAWSVKQSERHRGVGTRLLEEAVAYCRLRSLDGPVFADDHANAAQVLPGVFHGKFVEHDRWARRFLERVILEQKGR
ncbi:hypothetical protein AJ79_03240 [Helicocarpus griseus UAMH5409]|uniref:N-acetyltransferase domain-containing protein n=1 Tax=Helicocarpus griseus UAMH5409 TaxID=1447875 RepID=A0A2B7XZB8_9EURO|nr:hypothetical protein AJ79_03240 [Helicocarpus griseus UAMH5409]